MTFEEQKPISADHGASVIRYYDTHPINEDEILAKLAARGANLDALSEAELKEFDQDHYGGVQAVEVLAERAGIRRDHHVLDVCSGIGGPARWIAHRIGCRVTGLDFTRSRVESARRLARRARLDHLVDFVEGDATAMPMPAASYDAIIGQEAWVHIADKSTLVAECARVAKPSAMLAFTDIIARTTLTADEEAKLRWAIQAAATTRAQDYLAVLRSQHFEVSQCEDLSAEWTALLVDRLAMYRSLRDTTVAKFGDAHYEDWDRRYSTFVSLFESGRLGGVRIVARRNAA